MHILYSTVQDKRVHLNTDLQGAGLRHKKPNAVTNTQEEADTTHAHYVLVVSFFSQLEGLETGKRCN